MSKVDVNFLEEEVSKIWQRVQSSENRVDKITEELQRTLELAESKMSVDEAEAKKKLIDITTYSQRASDENEALKTMLSEISSLIDEYKQNKDTLSEAIQVANAFNTEYTNLSKTTAKIIDDQSKIQAIQSQTTSTLTNVENIEIKIQGTDKSTDELYTKIKDMYVKSSGQRNEIAKLYEEVFGYDNAEGEHENGLKDQLENTYTELIQKVKTISNEVEQLKKNKTKELNEVISNATAEHDEIVKKIESHLPGGVAAGLAGAFNEKKTTETETMNTASERFDNLLKWMIFVALIPFCVYVYWYHQDKTLAYIVSSIPSVTLSVLPLYAPLVWLAIHLNLKINLSKKLIEEYAYKEAICKSVTGMSEQIKNITNKNISQEIYTDLVRLIISASSDNPSKYITNYNKSDNPLIELLSHPEEFNKMFEKIPGLRDVIITSLENSKQTSNIPNKVVGNAE